MAGYTGDRRRNVRKKRLERVKIFVYRRVEDEVYGKKGLESIKIFVYRRVDNEVYEKKGNTERIKIFQDFRIQEKVLESVKIFIYRRVEDEMCGEKGWKA